MRKLRKIICCIILMTGVIFTLTGCGASYLQYSKLFENLQSTLEGIKRSDQLALNKLKASISYQPDIDRIDQMIAQIDSTYNKAVGGEATGEEDAVMQSISYLCPVTEVRALMSHDIAGQISNRLNSYVSAMQQKFLGSPNSSNPSTNKMQFTWNKPLYILEDISDGDVSVSFKKYNGSGGYSSVKTSEIECKVDWGTDGKSSPTATITGKSDLYSMMGEMVKLETGSNTITNDELWPLYSVYKDAMVNLSNELKTNKLSNNDAYKGMTLYYNFGVKKSGTQYYYLKTDGSKVLAGTLLGTTITQSQARDVAAWQENATTWSKLDDAVYTGELVSIDLYRLTTDNEYQLSVTVDINSDNALHNMIVTSDVNPISFFGHGVNDELNSMLSGPIFVLKHDFDSSGETLESVCDALSAAKAGIATTQQQAVINKVFTTIDSRGYEAASSEGNQQLDIFETKKFVRTDDYELMTVGSSLVLCKIRVEHLDVNEFENVMEMTEASESSGNLKYWWANKDSATATNKIYLMSYPLKYIKRIKSTCDPSTGVVEWYCEYDSACMYINLAAKQISYKEDGKDKLSLGNNLGEVYSFAPGNFSFTAVGESEKRVSAIKVGNGSITLQQSPVLVIRDYLEGIYLPSLSYGPAYREMYAALGRKLRVQKFSGSTGNEVFAYIVGKDGALVGGNTPLAVKVSDLASIEQIPKNQTTGSVKMTKLLLRSTYIENTKKHIMQSLTVDGVGNSGTDENGMIIDSKTVSKVYKDSIYTTVFGPEHGTFVLSSLHKVGAVDLNNTEVKVPNLFVIGTDYSIVASQLVTSWINAVDKGSGNLVWWNEWLSGNGFKYQVSLVDVEAALSETYRFDMAREGYTIIDLKTIAEITDIYNREELRNEAAWIRTFSLIAGLVLVAYSMLLLGAWVIDVNLGGSDYRLLGKLTFGRIVAVPSGEETMELEDSKVAYMSFGKLLMRCAIMIGVGLLLTLFDVIDLFYSLLNLVDGIISTIKEFVFNT